MSMWSIRPVVGGLLALALTGCGAETAPERTFGYADELQTPLRMVDGEPYLTCGAGPAFTTSALRDGVEGLVDEAEILAALDALRVDAGIDAPRPLQRTPTAEVDWKVLGGDRLDPPDTVIVWLGEVSSDPWARSAGWYAVFERAEGGWDPSSWGECSPEPVLADSAADWVEVTKPRGGLATDTTEVDVLVNERECTSGRDPRPFLREPVVVERERTVTVYWTSEAPTAEYVNCAGTGPVPARLTLSEPLGDRTLLDGSTWPARPVKPLPPEYAAQSR